MPSLKARADAGRAGRRASATAETRILRGVLFVVLAAALFVCMNTTVKYLSRSLPAVELIWARTLGHLIFAIAIFAPGAGGWRLFVTRRPGLQLARSMLLLASTSFFFTALGRVPLADATAVSFTAPVIVAALAGPLLGERVGRGHWLAIGLGLLGALIVVRPTGAGANPWIFLVFGSASSYALYQVLTRRVAGYDRPETSVSYSALLGTLALSCVVPFVWRTPERPEHWGLLAALGLFGGLGHYALARGFLWGPASVLSPFQYAQLLAAAALGYLVFGDVPTAWTWVGAACIVASGLTIAWREARRR